MVRNHEIGPIAVSPLVQRSNAKAVVQFTSQIMPFQDRSELSESRRGNSLVREERMRIGGGRWGPLDVVFGSVDSFSENLS